MVPFLETRAKTITFKYVFYIILEWVINPNTSSKGYTLRNFLTMLEVETLFVIFHSVYKIFYQSIKWKHFKRGNENN